MGLTMAGQHKPAAIVCVVIAASMICALAVGCGGSGEKPNPYKPVTQPGGSTKPVDLETETTRFYTLCNGAAEVIKSVNDDHGALIDQLQANASVSEGRALCNQYLPKFQGYQAKVQELRNGLDSLSLKGSKYLGALELEKQSLAQEDLGLNTICEGMRAGIAGDDATAVNLINSGNPYLAQALQLHNSGAELR